MRNPFYKYLTKEDHTQYCVVEWLKMKHNIQAIPMNTESNKTPFERFKTKHLGLHRGIPDLFIPVANSKYHGLFIELKHEDAKIWKKDGTLRKEEHLHIQNDYHISLRERGYYACFCVGFEQARETIEEYLRK